ncbi:MAG TPA: DUF4129 domain-containing protein [Gemmatimonadaceae bacterium]|jgi:hypothetical protein
MLLSRTLQVGGAAQAWSERAIHDTVARIAAEPKFTHAPRESLLGRLFRYLWRKLFDVIAWFSGRGDARLYLYGAIAVIAIVVVARIVAERQIAEARRQRVGSNRVGRSGGDLWTIANQTAARGQYADACHTLYAALLGDLAQSGAVRLHASKTSGDYARELQRRNFTRLVEYRAFVRDFNRAVFSTQDVSAGDYERVRRSALAVLQKREAA